MFTQTLKWALRGCRGKPVSTLFEILFSPCNGVQQQGHAGIMEVERVGREFEWPPIGAGCFSKTTWRRGPCDRGLWSTAVK